MGKEERKATDLSELIQNNNRNDKIQLMLQDEKRIKDFYRFTAQNPHLSLHDGCQIILFRSNATVCFTFEEWNAMGRRIIKGRKGIPYVDNNGYHCYAFDANDTHGEKRYQRLIYPMKRLLEGLDELNDTHFAEEDRNDFRKIHSGVASYLKNNLYYSEDEQRNSLLSEGIAYVLYCKTGFPKDNGITLHGFPYDLPENAELFREIALTATLIQQEIESVCTRRQSEIKLIEDVEDRVISDEPVISDSEKEEINTEFPKEEKQVEKGIKDRKRKPLSLFDLYTEKSEEEQFVEQQLKRGSGVVNGKIRIYKAYQDNPTVKAYATFLKREYGIGGSHSFDAELWYDAKGIRMVKHGSEHEISISLKWNETALRIADLIDDGIYLTEQEKKEYDQLLFSTNESNETSKEPSGRVDRFQSLAEKDQNFWKMFQNRTIFSPDNSPWGEVQTCQTIANGIYEVSTTRHGGIMIETELAQHILSPEAIQKGGEYGKYKCYEEDCDASIPLRELYDKGILKQTNDYFASYHIKEEEKEKFFSEWNENIDKSLAQWNKEYWQAHEQTKTNVSFQEHKIQSIVDAIVTEGTKKTSEGNWVIYFDEFGEDEPFVREHQDEIITQLEARVEVSDIVLGIDGMDINYYLDFCPNYEWKKDEKEENTDLNAIHFDQNELGGAKTRFKGNVEAIRLVKKLYAENRNPNDAEKQILAKYVGFGGLAKVFDEKDVEWKTEYTTLKELLTKEEYEKAKGSVLNAHYTSKEVIEGMYQALQRFGVKGNNRILEPAMGTGNFFGFMPKEIASGAKLYGVELDTLTGKIATKLYPEVKIQIAGFEQTAFADESFDIIVSNVPFGGYSVFDSAYNKYHFLIHDYFIAKGIDKLKPNGLMAVITSKGTMDKLNPSVRKYIADRAELIGAIRLPNNAFKQAANTEVVTDILFFQKRTEAFNADTENTEWLATGKTDEGFVINNYYMKHPEMILGTLAKERGLYGADNLTVKSDERDLEKALGTAISFLPENIYENPSPYVEEEQDELEADYSVKPLCYKAQNGKLYLRIGDHMVEQNIPKSPKDAYSRIAQMIALRNDLRHILDLQTEGCSDQVLIQEQRKLNARYDAFVKTYGFLNSQTNTRLFKDDGDAALLFASEILSDDRKSATKADIFAKRTIRPYTAVNKTDDCFEALQISKNERGCVDISYIEDLTGKDYDTVLKELGNAVFRNPIRIDPQNQYSGFETAEEYLSGNVVKKWNVAKQFAQEDTSFEKNATALSQVQPVPLTASEISVRIGASWVDQSYYKQFLCELLEIPFYLRYGIEFYYNPHDSSWRIDRTSTSLRGYRSQRILNYGTERASVYRLFEDCLNLKATTIYDTIQTDDGEKRVLNHEETIAAREKQNQIKDQFKEWIFYDAERREALERTYNSLFNQMRLPNYDGSYLKFPEMNPAIELNPHQKNAVHRIITSGNTLLHHVVGAGKTYTICAAAMKLRQYGLAKKPMIVVPNHLVQQWAGEFRTLYPNAQLLVASKEDLEKNNRQKFVSKVAMGDWDAVIIAQSSFAKIPISQERQIRKIKEEISHIEESIQQQQEESAEPHKTVKNLERIKKSREVMLKRLLDDNKKDNVLIFERLGVDYLFVDEAHAYKNLFLFTKMNNVAGISNAASQRASDIQLKCEYINELHQGDIGVVFATGTPISNSMTEMYTMQTYLGKRTLEELGIHYFDNWAADFGETVTSLEMAPSGQGYRAKTRFAKFTNLPELLRLYRSFADVQTSDMIHLEIPETDKEVITLKPSDTVIDLAEEIAERAERINSGGVDPHIDNMLKITSDGKKLALDPRCYDPASVDEEGSKINACALRIYEIWEETKEQRLTQLVFCDMSTPKKAFADYVYGQDFDAYNDLKYKLVQKGIPEDEIAYIHEANSDLQKQSLFDKVNAGKVRVLIGSTEKCGAGTNVQERLVALHHLDTPFRPSDMEQREGRIKRRGNKNKRIRIYTYVKERTFDSYSYQILENKQRFIAQVNRGDLTIREAEDIDETTLTYAEIKAITAANPKIKRKMELDSEITRLRILEGQYRKNLYALQDKVRKILPEQIQRQQLYITHLQEDIAHIQNHYHPDSFWISVGGKVYTDKKEGSRALTDALYASQPDTIVAEYGGFKISMNPIVLLTIERQITLHGEGQYVMDIGSSAVGNMQRLDHFLADFINRESKAITRLEQLKNDLEVAKEQVALPFEHRATLDELTKELNQINAELDLNRREEIIVGDEKEEEQYMGIPETKQIEANWMEEIDRVSTMEVPILPDYTTTQEAMHEYGYMWEGMLPMKPIVAKGLYDLGVPVFSLYGDDTESQILSFEDIEMQDGLFGVEKPDWEKWLKTDKAIQYLFARHAVCEAAEKGVREEMDYMDERFTISFSDTNYEERTALDNFLKTKKMPAAEKMKPYLGALIEEFTTRIGGWHLEHYGWEHDDVSRMIVKNIKSEELNRYAQYVLIEKGIHNVGLSAFLYREVQTLSGTRYDLTSEQVKAMLPSLKAIIQESKWNGCEKGESYDEWFHWFAKSVLPTYLDMKKGETLDLVEIQKVTQKEKRQMEENQYEKKTKNGYPVINMIKDESNRNIAIFQRKDDYVVAAGYNTEDGTWAQGIYDFPTLQAAENYRTEKYGQKSDKPKRTWLKVNVAKTARIKDYEKHSFFRMPTSNPEYAGYTYNIFNNRIKESRQLVDLQSDGHELCYELRVAEDEEIVLHNKEKDEVILTGKEFAALVGGSSLKDYEFRSSDEDKSWLTISVPQEAMLGMYENSSLFLMPKFTEQAGYSFYLPNRFLEEDKDSEDGRVIMRLPDDFKITAKDRKSGDTVELTAYQLYKRMDNTQADDYIRERRTESGNTGESNSANGWHYVSVPDKAKITEYEYRTLFRMPSGEYDGYVYYIPNKLVKANEEKGTIRISLPEDFTVLVMKKDEDKEFNFSVEEYLEAIKDKTDEDYQTAYRKPSEGGADRFTKHEKLLRTNVPEEMRNKPNWVIVRTRMNEAKGRLEKFLISPLTDKFAESDNPETWTDFETACKYAHENGGDTLAYALDGKDGIACIDLDHCKDKDGYSPLAKEVLQKCGKTYIEESVSGNGLHIFGKTNGMDLRTFSHDGDLEFYQKTHFIAMTGDGAEYAELSSFDAPAMKNLLESKCDKRRELKGSGRGVEGLSSMSDRDVVEKAYASKYGDTFKALYEGQDLQNNHSNSDMSLMNRLAFWCNGDKEQMLRIFATSGLYRPEKSTSYYEATAIKAVRDTVSRFQPQTQSAPQPMTGKKSDYFGKA